MKGSHSQQHNYQQTGLLPFTKMVAYGNDFILVNGFNNIIKDPNKLAKDILDRHFGIGADGFIIAMPSDKADFRMRFFNPDGNEAETCGNGVRCLSVYAYNEGIVKNDTFTIDTLAGIIKPKIFFEGEKIKELIVDMGKPRLKRSQIPMLGNNDEMVLNEALMVKDKVFTISCNSMGNPHCVVWVEDLSDNLVKTYGPLIEKHEKFPEYTNVEFTKIISKDLLEMKIWERGVGITLSCGTGACSAVATGSITGQCERKAMVNQPGGTLTVNWDEDGILYLTGTCHTVCIGNYNLNNKF